MKNLFVRNLIRSIYLGGAVVVFVVHAGIAVFGAFCVYSSGGIYAGDYNGIATKSLSGVSHTVGGSPAAGVESASNSNNSVLVLGGGSHSSSYHVVLDAGHGGRDAGVTSKGGVCERDVALNITNNLKAELEQMGMRVTLTRTQEASLADPSASNQKRSDMKARKTIIQDAAPDLVLSIHLNNFAADSSVHGMQCFFQIGRTDDIKFANHIQTSLNNTNLFRARTALKGDYYILRSGYPSVLIECGFLSNAREESLLKTPEYQQKIAHEIAKAISEIRDMATSVF